MPQKQLKNLPDGARKVWEAVYKSCSEKEDATEEFCAEQAWGAVKKSYKKTDDGWVKKSQTVADLDMTGAMPSHQILMGFNKKSVRDGKLRWQATASDIEPDTRGDRTSTELFESFIRNADKNDPVYLSVAHYFDYEVPAELRSNMGERAVAGWADKHWIDGDCFKSDGYFEETPIGLAAFKAIREDDDVKPENPVRVSLGFLDMAHEHDEFEFEFVRQSLSDTCPLCEVGIGGKVFREGVLIHEALTRVPVNPRTPIVAGEGKVLMSDANTIKSRKDDARSIIGEELAEELDKLSKGEGTVAQSFVTHSDSEDETTVEKKSFGVTSFREALDLKEARGRVDEIWRAWDTLAQVVYNIMDEEDVEDKKGAVEVAIDEFKEYVTALSFAGENPMPDTLDDAASKLVNTIRGLNELEEDQDPVAVYNAAAQEFIGVAQEYVPGVEQKSESEPEVEEDEPDVADDDVHAVIQSTVKAAKEEWQSDLDPIRESLNTLSQMVGRQRGTTRAGMPPSSPLLLGDGNITGVENPMQTKSEADKPESDDADPDNPWGKGKSIRELARTSMNLS